MKSLDQKLRFIEMRAGGISLSKISQELGISKKTCSNWNTELNDQIQKEHALRIDEARTLYSMQKEDRIKRLSKLLVRLDDEIDTRDLSTLSTENLIKLKLRFEGELSKEVVHKPSVEISQGTQKEVLVNLVSLYKDVANGDIPTSQAKLQLDTLKEISNTIERDQPVW